MAKKRKEPITDLENLIDWFYELTMNKGYNEAEALNYMQDRAPLQNLKQLIQKLQLNVRIKEC